MSTVNKIVDQISSLTAEFDSKLAGAHTLEQLEEVRVQFLGRNGKITQFLKSIKDFSESEKKIWGPQFNELKKSTAQNYQKCLLVLQADLAKATQATQMSFDVTTYLPKQIYGS